MKNKNISKISAIILVVIGVVLIIFSFLVSDKKEFDNKPNNDNSNVDVVPDIPKDEDISISYDTVLEMANNLYGGDGFVILVKEEEDRFVIERTYKLNENVEIYFVDKVTGSIYSDSASSVG